MTKPATLKPPISHPPTYHKVLLACLVALAFALAGVIGFQIGYSCAPRMEPPVQLILPPEIGHPADVRRL